MDIKPVNILMSERYININEFTNENNLELVTKY